jgi:hypothetical protein
MAQISKSQAKQKIDSEIKELDNLLIEFKRSRRIKDHHNPTVKEEFKRIMQNIQVQSDKCPSWSDAALTGAGLIEKEFYIRQNILKEMGKSQELHNQLLYAKEHKSASIIKDIAKKLGVPDRETQAEIIAEIMNKIIQDMRFYREQLALLAMFKERLLQIMENEYKIIKNKKIKADKIYLDFIEKLKNEIEREKLLADERRKRDAYQEALQQEIQQLKARLKALDEDIRRLESENFKIRLNIVSTMKNIAKDILNGVIVPANSSIDKDTLHKNYIAFVDKFDAGYLTVDKIAEELRIVINNSGKDGVQVKEEDAQAAFDKMYGKIVNDIALYQINEAEKAAKKMERADGEHQLKAKIEISSEVPRIDIARLSPVEAVAVVSLVVSEPLTPEQQKVINDAQKNLAEVDACVQLVCADPTKPLIEQPKLTALEVEQKQAQHEGKEFKAEVGVCEAKEQKPEVTSSTIEEKTSAQEAPAEISSDSGTPSPVSPLIEDKIEMAEKERQAINEESKATRDDFEDEEEQPTGPKMGR